MAWTELTRRQHARAGKRYASDLTDAEWALIAPLMPPVKTTGRPRTTYLRDVFDAILYMATTGCQWRMLVATLAMEHCGYDPTARKSDAPARISGKAPSTGSRFRRRRCSSICGMAPSRSPGIPRPSARLAKIAPQACDFIGNCNIFVFTFNALKNPSRN